MQPYSFTVVKRTNVNFKFTEDCDIQKLAEEFSTYMFEANSLEYVEYISKQLQDGSSFIEGVGKVAYSNSLTFDYIVEDDVVLVYNLETIECDIE